MDFSSPTSIIAIAIVGIGLVLIVRFLSRAKPTREVLFLRPRDRRGERLIITRETDRSVACERANPIHRFLKAGAGYTFREGGRMVTKFWGIEGTAYTAVLSKGTEVKMLVWEYLKDLWGDRVYDRMPAEQKRKLEEGKIGVLIQPIPIDEKEHGYPTMTSDDIDDEGDAVVLRRIADTAKPNTKRELYQMMIGALLGAGGIAILLRMGLF